MRTILLLAGLLAVTTTEADVPGPDDFAYGIPIDVHGQAALWRLDLPEAVYRGVTREDLGDLRVFDATGRLVPHSLQTPTATPGDAPPPEKLSFFPLYGQVAAGNTTGLRIITDSHGTIIDTGRPPDGELERQVAYLLDLSALQQTPARLRLDWRTNGDKGFAVNVQVEASDDLKHWRPVVDDAVLADLQADGETLRQHDIPLPQGRMKYLRIDWPAALKEVQLTAVQAEFAGSAAPLPRHWLTLSGRPDPQYPSRYLYDSAGLWPVDRLQLQFDDRNLLLRGVLWSRSDEQADWRQRFQGVFYRLQHATETLRNPPATVSRRIDRYWRLDLPTEGAVVAAPRLALGWLPQQLTFVAQGSAPYMLAFGSATVGPAGQAMTGLLPGMDKTQRAALVARASPGEQRLLGGPARLQPPAPPLPWKIWLLWGVLSAGLLLLAWMVRHLYRQMNGDSADGA